VEKKSKCSFVKFAISNTKMGINQKQKEKLHGIQNLFLGTLGDIPDL
jgi:hypothetical protein